VENRVIANEIRSDTPDRIAGDLIELLHRGAPAEDFARRLEKAEALPEEYPGKSMLLERARMAAAVRDRLELQQQREQGVGPLERAGEDGVAHEQVIELGMRTADGKVEVKRGLAIGDQLVVRGAEALHEGSQVKESAATPTPAGGPATP